MPYLSLLIVNSQSFLRQYSQFISLGFWIDQPQDTSVFHFSELGIVRYGLPGVDELAALDLEGDGQRSLTRRLQ
jgi:hypothetical protein